MSKLSAFLALLFAAQAVVVSLAAGGEVSVGYVYCLVVFCAAALYYSKEAIREQNAPTAADVAAVFERYFDRKDTA
jgi:uncharacterized membrane protein